MDVSVTPIATETQQLFLFKQLYPFRRHSNNSYQEEQVIIEDHTKSSAVLNINHPFPWDNENPPPVPLLKSEVRKYNLTNVLPLLDIRLSEGFKIESIEQNKNEFGWYMMGHNSFLQKFI